MASFLERTLSCATKLSLTALAVGFAVSVVSAKEKPEVSIIDISQEWSFMDQDTRNLISEQITRFDVVELSTVQLFEELESADSGIFRVRLSLDDQPYMLEIERTQVADPDLEVVDESGRSIFDSSAERDALLEGIRTFKGHIVGLEGSHVRLTATDEMLTGYVNTGESKFKIDPLSLLLRRPAGSKVVVYRASDIVETGATCGTGDNHKVPDLGSGPNRRSASSSLRSGSEAFRTPHLKMEIVADDAYVSASGSDSQAVANVLDTTNRTEGFYNNTPISILLNVRVISLHENYGCCNANTMLEAFRVAVANRYRNGIDSIHLFTGHELDGDTIGLAYVGTTCATQPFSSGLNQSANNSHFAELFAHELGHNLSMNHLEHISCYFATGPLECSSLQGAIAPDIFWWERSNISNHLNTYLSQCFSD